MAVMLGPVLFGDSPKKTTICSLYDSQHVQENGSWDFLIVKTANAVVDNNCFSLQN